MTIMSTIQTPYNPTLKSNGDNKIRKKILVIIEILVEVISLYKLILIVYFWVSTLCLVLYINKFRKENIKKRKHILDR